MRVVLMPSSYAPHLGGVENVARHLATGLVDEGHQPLVITNRWPKSLSGREVIDGIDVRRSGFRVPQRSLRGVGGYLTYNRAARQEVIAAAKQHGCEIVNLHCVSSNARYALAVVDALNVPLVVSLHGELSGDATQVYARDADLRRQWTKLMDRADLVTAPSRYTLDEATELFGRSFRAEQVIHNGVDRSLFTGVRSPERVVLAAGRLVPNKGFDLLVDAWQHLPADLRDVRLEIAGDGWAEAGLRSRIAASPAGDRISLVGRLSPSDLADRLRRAAAFVLPSRAESLGLAILEAMAAGTPVLAARVGGVPEIVRDGDTGLLFDAGRPTSLADRLTSLLRDEPAAAVRARNAMTLVATLDWSTCAAAYSAGYGDVIGAGR